jgi:hypothetical protein
VDVGGAAPGRGAVPSWPLVLASVRFEWSPGDGSIRWRPAAGHEGGLPPGETVTTLTGLGLADVERALRDAGGVLVLAIGARAASEGRHARPTPDGECVVVLAEGAATDVGLGVVVELDIASSLPGDDPARRRVRIEQAKGVLTARFGLSPDSSFAELRQLSRNSNRRVADVAERVVAGASTHEQTSEQESVHPDDVLGRGSMFRLLDGLVTPALVLRALRRAPADEPFDMEVEHANPTALDLEDRGPGELLGRRVLRLWPGLVSSGIWDVYRQVLRTQLPYTPMAPTPWGETVHGRAMIGQIPLHVLPMGPDHLVVNWINDPKPRPDPHRSSAAPDR